MSTRPPPARDRDTLVSLVSPVHDEVDGLARFVDRVREVLDEAHPRFELVLVDDGSRDGSWGVIEAAAAADPRVRGIRLSRNFGKEAALVAGIEDARGEAVVVLDSDLQHPPTLLPVLLEHWRQGAEVVEAVKHSRTGQPLGGRVAAALFNGLFSRTTGVDLAGASDYRLLGRAALEAWRSLPERTLFFRGTSTWVGFDRVQVPFEVDARAAGRTRWTSATLMRLAVDGLTSFTAAPLRLVTVAAGLFALFALALGIQTLVRFASGDAVQGFTTVILLLLVQGTITLFGLGIIGEYVARIHDEVKGRPRYLVADRAGDARTRGGEDDEAAGPDRGEGGGPPGPP